MTVAAMALAGGLGAGLRFMVDGWISRRARLRFPVGTFAVNVSASFLLGLLTGLAVGHDGTSSLNVVLGTGLLGGYSTFSATTVESIRLMGDGARRDVVVALGYAAGTAAACFAAAAVGFHIV
jgi:fluoride exporter